MQNNQKLAAARLKLAYERPYIATAIWALIPIEKEGLGTLGVDKFWRLYYDPEVVEKWDNDELTSVLFHEICHLLRNHAQRAENLDPQIYNLAGDMEINDDIRSEGTWKLPGNCLYPDLIGAKDGELAEKYYELIIEQAKKNAGQEPKPGDIVINLPGDPGPGAGSCGSAAHGNNEGHEEGKPQDGNGVMQGEGELLRRQIAKEINEGPNRGTVPDHLKRWAKEHLTPQVNWRKELATVIRNAITFTRGCSDYTFTKQSRRNFDDIILPATHAPNPNISVVVDTSGSMSEKQLDAAMTEIKGILKRMNAAQGIRVLTVDAKVHAVKKVFSTKNIELKGGGGTDMRLGLNAAYDSKPRPDITILLTDGYTPWPDHPYAGMRTIVVLINPGSHPETPSWLKTIKITER